MSQQQFMRYRQCPDWFSESHDVALFTRLLYERLAIDPEGFCDELRHRCNRFGAPVGAWLGVQRRVRNGRTSEILAAGQTIVGRKRFRRPVHTAVGKNRWSQNFGIDVREKAGEFYGLAQYECTPYRYDDAKGHQLGTHAIESCVDERRNPKLHDEYRTTHGTSGNHVLFCIDPRKRYSVADLVAWLPMVDRILTATKKA